MAILKMELTGFEFDFMRTLQKAIPELNARIMGFIGSEGKEKLYNKFLKGQEGITLRAAPYDRTGKRTYSYSVGRNGKHVIIASYPFNFFESGRRLRNGKKEAGRHIVGKKFKTFFMAELQSVVNKADAKILQTELDRIVK
jgi:hypothetical protein